MQRRGFREEQWEHLEQWVLAVPVLLYGQHTTGFLLRR